MKKLLLILILTLSFQSWIKADDIKDFQIEGILLLVDALPSIYCDHLSSMELCRVTQRESGSLHRFVKMHWYRCRSSALLYYREFRWILDHKRTI